MQIVSTQHDDVTVISIQGKLDATTAQETTAVFDKEIGAGHVKLVIDFGAVSYISSAGILAVFAAAQNARSAGGDVRLAGVEGHIKRTLETAGFTRVMVAFDSTDEAVASYTA